MTRRWVTRIGALSVAIAAVLGLANCGNDVAAPHLEPARTELLGSVTEDLTRTLTGNDQLGEYTLIRERLELPVDLDASKIIGIQGGSLSLLGHRIDVPAGAVSRPVLFTMVVSTPGFIEVELDATISGLFGRVIDVGGAGFDRPVQLSLTYARATNVEDPADLVILRRLPSGAVEELPSRVDGDRQTVTAELEHFSRYCMAAN